jgi:CspA family cold shock protein
VSRVPSGRVKWYDADKGFGFLAQDGGEDVYVRKAALPAGVEGLKPGQRVEFGMAEGRRGHRWSRPTGGPRRTCTASSRT